jgi:hypothetical protein
MAVTMSPQNNLRRGCIIHNAKTITDRVGTQAQHLTQRSLCSNEIQEVKYLLVIIFKI